MGIDKRIFKYFFSQKLVKIIIWTKHADEYKIFVALNKKPTLL